MGCRGDHDGLPSAHVLPLDLLVVLRRQARAPYFD